MPRHIPAVTNPVALLCALMHLPAEIAGLRADVRRISQRIEALANKLDAEIAALQASVTRIEGVAESSAALLAGLKGQLDEAIANASAGGATADQLSSLVALSSALDTESDKLAAAVAANTPTASAGNAPPVDPNAPSSTPPASTDPTV